MNGSLKPSDDKLHLRFWLATAIVAGLLLWLLAGMLLPFILGMAIAYFLDPLVARMSRLGLARWACALIVLVTFIFVVVLLSILLLPTLRTQLSDLIESLPLYMTTVQNFAIQHFKQLAQQFPFLNAEKLQNGAVQHTGEVMTFAGRFLGGILVGALSLLDILALFFLTPVIAFYLLRDWPKIITTIDSLLPRAHAATIHAELTNMDRMVSGYVRGQAMVSMCLAVLYSVGLSLIGLKYGMVIGLAGGFLTFIPYIGTLTVTVCSLVTGFIQFGGMEGVLPIIGLLLFAQLLEGYVLTPRLVGGSVGLHPVWIMFAILAGGKLFGFVGVLLGVPFLGAVAILLRLGLRQYRKSRYYTGAA